MPSSINEFSGSLKTKFPAGYRIKKYNFEIKDHSKWTNSIPIGWINLGNVDL